MAKLTTFSFAEKLIEAGVFTREEMNQIHRIVIDLNWKGPPMMYVERYADDVVLDVLTTLDGIKIVGVSDAQQRITLAKQALVATGYFDEDQVTDDIAPRITEFASRKADRDEVGHMVYLNDIQTLPGLCHCVRNEAHLAVEP